MSASAKERPILFSGPMVRAILEGQKTVTRRALSARHLKLIEYGAQAGECHNLPDSGSLHPNSVQYYADFCPFGQPGDLLWVRETWMDLRGTGVEHRPTPDSPLQRYAYGADSPPGSHSDEARKDFGLKWRPSIHMPRVACRILLEITEVRVERLQHITIGEICKEGLARSMYEFIPVTTAFDAFAELWNSTGGDWDANPWVWVVEFKRVTP